MNVPCSSTPAGPLRSATAALRCCLPPFGRRRLPRFPTFRGSITRPAHSLSTLRRVGYPTATQDSLPAAGQPYRAGLVTRWVPTKGFRSSHPPFPGFAWRTHFKASKWARGQTGLSKSDAIAWAAAHELVGRRQPVRLCPEIIYRSGVASAARERREFLRIMRTDGLRRLFSSAVMIYVVFGFRAWACVVRPRSLPQAL